MHSPENSKTTDESSDTIKQPSADSIFRHTIQVLRQQRDSNADLVVQMSARAMALDEIIAAQQKSMRELQERYDDLYREYYRDKCDSIGVDANDASSTFHCPV